MTTETICNREYNPWFCKWLNEHMGKFAPHAKFDPANTIAFANVEDKANILFVAAYHARTFHTTQISCASNGEKRQKLNHDFLYKLFSYAFITDKRTAIYSTIDMENTASIALCEKCGFQRVGTLPECNGEGRDCFVYALTKKQWLEHPYSKVPTLEENS
jgi:hypothetical protein